MEVLREVALCLCLHQLTIYFAAHRHYLLVLAEAASEVAYPNKLELNVGLRLSVRDSFDDNGNLIPDTRFSAAIPALNQAWFLPILATRSFTSPNSPTSDSPPGFALGFFFNKALPDSITNIYLAVCGGLSRHNSSDPGPGTQLMGIDDDLKGIYLLVPTVRDGYAVPMWYANVTSLTSYNASLVVKKVADNKKNNTVTKQLQLEDHDGTVFWKVRNAGLMEMQETGILVIFDAVNKTKVLWRSSRDTLFCGEKLNVGKTLTSIDSSYSARMEEGGIVLSLNTLQFMNEQPAPYWALPLELFDSNLLNASKQVFLKSPCASLQSSNKSSYNITISNHTKSINISNQVLPLSSQAYAMLDNSLNFILSPGSCSSTNLSLLSSQFMKLGSNANASGPLSFVKLDNGWLHSYAVPLQLDNQAAINPYVLDVYETHVSGDPVQNRILQLSVWKHCAIPNYCGPLGVCSPSSSQSNACTCPSGTIIDSNEAKRGCSRRNPLPHCNKDGHANTTDFLQLNHTASIFLFSGWAFNSTPGEVTDCMRLCLANCYCNGFFYNFACFFITDEMSLLNLTDYTGEGGEDVDIRPSNYVTYLKRQKSNLSSPTPAPRSPSPENSKSMAIAIATLLSFAICVGLGVALYVIRARAAKRRYMSKQAAKEEEELKDVLPLLPSRFSYDELHRATKGFSELLGAGGCGSVYAGTLLDGTKVAVKALELAVKWQSKQFLAEVATIGRTSHHNIVRLVGFCWEVSNRLLVYEYMENGSLDQWIFIKARGMDAPHVGAPSLDWQTRYNVVLGIARGLSYLHEDCPQPILHFDIKPQNILLDRAFVAKLADFGMSKLIQRDISEIVTGVRGTPGYIAPEWVSHGAVSKKSDIYSMGVVMLEIVGGRKNVDLELLNDKACLKCDSSSAQMEEEWHFVSWAARKCEQGMAMDVVDRRLQCAYNEEQAQRLIYIAFWCIQEDPGMRPYVPTVVKWLEGSSPVQKPPFSSAAHSYSRSRPISSQRLSLTASSSSTPPPPLT